MCQFGGQVLRRYDLREFDSAGEMDSNKFRQSMLLEPSCCRRDYPDKLNDLLARFFSLLSENDDTFSGVAMGILTYETFRLYHIFKASPVAESKLSPVHRELLHATSFSPNWDGNMLDIVNIIRHWGPIVFDALIAGDDPDPMLAYSFCRIRLALFLLSRGVEPSLFDNDPHLTENPAGVARGLQLMTMYQWQPSQPKTTPCD
jgi:hypothetical protein